MNDQRFERELYPFLFADSSATAGGTESALVDACQSTLRKRDDVMGLRERILEEHEATFLAASAAMAARFARGGKLLAFGNGGSATDAHDAELDCQLPAFGHWRALPALALTGDPGVLTAITNDVGFDRVFMRQVIALGISEDIAIGFSTSGNSRNVIEGLAEARRLGMMTIAITGSDGGAMSAPGTCDYCFVARTEQVPRIQEGQATIWHALLELVQATLAETGT